MLRLILFVGTNLAIMLVLSIVVSLFGLDRFYPQVLYGYLVVFPFRIWLTLTAGVLMAFGWLPNA